MFRTSITTALLAPGLALAAPEDYADHVPHNIRDMELQDWSMDDDILTAFYGETIGRATLRIFPAPQADPAGAAAGETSGSTPAAQRAMLDLLSRNLDVGTNALGDGYTTNPVRLFSIRLDGGDALEGELACGYIERVQADERADADAGPMSLSDRICVSQHEDDIISVYITTPNRESLPLDVESAQINFAGQLIGTVITLASGEDLPTAQTE
ncbi:hypothetical protein [Yoonia sp.]|uniref:hypothetical protein n=1 Tax=Yoonia sp. TaxID=2212373 RepID=UPI00391D07D2